MLFSQLALEWPGNREAQLYHCKVIKWKPASVEWRIRERLRIDWDRLCRQPHRRPRKACGAHAVALLTNLLECCWNLRLSFPCGRQFGLAGRKSRMGMSQKRAARQGKNDGVGTARLNNRRRCQGQLMIEMTVGMIALLPVILCIFDLIVVVIGVTVNDAACRELARAASMGSPAQYLDRANAVAQKHPFYQLRGAVGNLRVIKEQSSNSSQKSPDDKIGEVASGTVTITSQLDVYPPFIIGAIHKQITGSSVIPSIARQTMPYSYAVANRSEN